MKTIDKMLNKADAEALFKNEAVLIGSNDVIPEHRAIRLFDASAADFAKHKPGETYNLYGFGGHTNIAYLTRSGFFLAASNSNMERCFDEMKAAQA